MVPYLMRLQINDSKVTHLFFASTERTCPGCGREQRYAYKSSGRHFYQLDGLYYLDAQIVHCFNGQCPLRYRRMHPPGELALVPPKKGFGFDVIARIGQLRFGRKLTRAEIKARLAIDHPALEISERQVEYLFDLYGELVAGTVLTDPEVIKRIRANKAMVLSIDGSKPMRDHESVWFVRDLMSGITLAAAAMGSCTTAALVGLLTPVKLFAREHGVAVAGIVSDAEPVVRSGVRKVFPKIRHQLCQFHYVDNLADPLAKEDRKLREAVKEAMRDLGKIESAIKADHSKGGGLTKAQTELLEEVGDGIRSILRDNGKPPFEPPGLILVEKLKVLRKLVAQMTREKGGAFFGHSSNSSPSQTKSKRTKVGSVSSTRTSGTSEKSSLQKVRQPRERNASFAR
jgi:hypothetical protein